MSDKMFIERILKKMNYHIISYEEWYTIIFTMEYLKTHLDEVSMMFCFDSAERFQEIFES